MLRFALRPPFRSWSAARHGSWLGRGAILVLQLAFLVYMTLCLYSMYRHRYFAFHDVTLINDWFTNALYEGRPFHITDMDLNHLRLHFTPSLLVLAPLYGVFSSQFVLLATGAIGYSIALFLALRLGARVLDRTSLGRDGLLRPLALAGIFAVLAFNVFGRTVVAAGHFEVLYMPGALGVLYALLRHTRPLLLAVALAWTLGIRQDAGAFLAFQACALLLIPRRLASDAVSLRRRAGLVAGASILYTATVVLIVSPWLGASPRTELWAHWGGSWGAILAAFLRSPGRLWEAVASSGFLALNASFHYVPLLAHGSWVLANLPGLILYTTATPHTRHLWYYTSAFLLPGLYLSALMAVYLLLRGIDRLAAASRLQRGLRWLFVLALATLAGFEIARGGTVYPTMKPGEFAYRPIPQDPVAAGIWRALEACPGIASVASDFRNVVFVPNRYRKYLLRNYAHADAVFVANEAHPMLLGFPTVRDLEAALERHPDFVRQEAGSALRVYFKRRFACTLRGSILDLGPRGRTDRVREDDLAGGDAAGTARRGVAVDLVQEAVDLIQGLVPGHRDEGVAAAAGQSRPGR